jgi:antitoxin (DNA-binding transcriptional repressor) of toxin-antitoxin stability system
MKAVERVGVKNLKNNLSAYLRRVKRGVRVLVTDRDEVIAEIGKPQGDVAREGIHPLLAEWIAAGDLKPASVRKRRLPRSPVSLPAGTAQRLLDEDRGE